VSEGVRKGVKRQMEAVKGSPGSLDHALKPFEILHGKQGNSAKMVVLGFSKTIPSSKVY
jgi:hypothetical protein